MNKKILVTGGGGYIGSIATSYFIKEGYDSLMTVKDEQVHSIYKDVPVNFNKNGIFTQTQDLDPVRLYVYSTMVWRADVFKRAFEKKGYALLCGRLGHYTVSKLSSIIIKKADDLMIADHMMRSIARTSTYKPSYDRIACKIRPKGKN